ncbi:MAG: LON peptidase substrate-binding domain-containing protein, partial [Deltaproteobacteria bacterium]|nr:LON peptidase substrate-binding domain-containing protein [Deltaproteobacteria bacterium]
MKKFIKPEELDQHVASIPNVLPILPLRNIVAYPFSILPLAIGIPRSVKLVKDALQGDHIVGLVAIKDESIEEPL